MDFLTVSLLYLRSGRSLLAVRKRQFHGLIFALYWDIVSQRYFGLALGRLKNVQNSLRNSFVHGCEKAMPGKITFCPASLYSLSA